MTSSIPECLSDTTINSLTDIFSSYQAKKEEACKLLHRVFQQIGAQSDLASFCPETYRYRHLLNVCRVWTSLPDDQERIRQLISEHVARNEPAPCEHEHSTRFCGTALDTFWFPLPSPEASDAIRQWFVCGALPQGLSWDRLIELNKMAQRKNLCTLQQDILASIPRTWESSGNQEELEKVAMFLLESQHAPPWLNDFFKDYITTFPPTYEHTKIFCYFQERLNHLDLTDISPEIDQRWIWQLTDTLTPVSAEARIGLPALFKKWIRVADRKQMEQLVQQVVEELALSDLDEELLQLLNQKIGQLFSVSEGRYICDSPKYPPRLVSPDLIGRAAGRIAQHDKLKWLKGWFKTRVPEPQVLSPAFQQAWQTTKWWRSWMLGNVKFSYLNQDPVANWVARPSRTLDTSTLNALSREQQRKLEQLGLFF